MENSKRGCTSSSPAGPSKKAKVGESWPRMSPIPLEDNVDFDSPSSVCSQVKQTEKEEDIMDMEEDNSFGSEEEQDPGDYGEVKEEEGNIMKSPINISPIPPEMEIEFNTEVESLNQSFMNLTASEVDEEELVAGPSVGSRGFISTGAMPMGIVSYAEFVNEWENDIQFKKFGLILNVGVSEYNKKVFPNLEIGEGGYYLCEFCHDDLVAELELEKKLGEDIGCGCHEKIYMKALAAEVCLREICWNIYKENVRALKGSWP